LIFLVGCPKIVTGSGELESAPDDDDKVVGLRPDSRGRSSRWYRRNCVARAQYMRGMRNYIELTVLTALAVVSAVAALMHGDVLFGVVFGAAAGVGGGHLIRRSVDL
jgi:hypothetical protein